MGVIKRQTLYGSLYLYLGVFIGFVTTGILFPNYFTSEEVGIINMLVVYSTIFAQLASLGFNNATFRLFPYFRSSANKHNGFLFIALITGLVGFLLTILIVVILKPYLTSFQDGSPTLMAKYYYYIIPLVFAVLYFNLFDAYYTVLYNSVIGTFLKELVLRIVILLAFLGFFFKFYSYHGFVNGFTIGYFVPLLVIFVFLFRSGQIDFRPKPGFLNSNLVKTLSAVSLFGLISYSTDVIVFNIDRIMIERFMGLSDTGIYSTAFLFGSIVIVPSRSLYKISIAVIADAWKNNDHKNLSEIYRKSCINQFFIGTLILLLIIVNIDNIMQLIPSTYADGKNVILLVSIAMLFNMVVGVNNVLIMTSKEYRMNAYILILLAIMIIVFNYIFIPLYGILGAAIATLISKFLINLIRAVYVRIKFGLQPYNYKFLFILFIFGISFLISYFIPVMDNFILDGLVRSTCCLVVFGTLSLITNVSEEFRGIVISSYAYIKKAVNR